MLRDIDLFFLTNGVIYDLLLLSAGVMLRAPIMSRARHIYVSGWAPFAHRGSVVWANATTRFPSHLSFERWRFFWGGGSFQCVAIRERMEGATHTEGRFAGRAKLAQYTLCVPNKPGVSRCLGIRAHMSASLTPGYHLSPFQSYGSSYRY